MFRMFQPNFESYDSYQPFEPSEIEWPKQLFPFLFRKLNMQRFQDLEESQPTIGRCLYMPNNLLDLLNNNDIYRSDKNGKEYKVVRFAVNEKGDLIFGNEGCPDTNTPAHCQLVGDITDKNAIIKCITAGNAYFDDNNELAILDHKSGDFRPSFESLLVALKKFLEHSICMNKTIIVAKLTPSGGDEIGYICDTTTLKEQLIPIHTP